MSQISSMCGFAGFIKWGPQSSRNDRDAVLAAFSQQIGHRGPDDEQFFVDDALSLVFRRLSIVGGARGAQPVWNKYKTLLCVANAEIYNACELAKTFGLSHLLRTPSDVEIVVHLYEKIGTEVFQHLRGKFAVLLWDLSQQSLVLARDRMGVKPLYYYLGEDLLIFGSELKALLAHPQCPKEVDWRGLEFGKNLDDPSFRVPSYIKGVEHLPPGSFAHYQRGDRFRIQPYWAIENHLNLDKFRDWTEAQSVEHVGFLLQNAVRVRAQTEVGVGVFLSGGLDSSLVAAMGARVNPSLKCFSVISEGALRNGDAAHAESLARHLGLEFHGVRFDRKDLIQCLGFNLASLEHMVWLLDSPRFDFEIFFKHELHRYAKTHFPEIKVMLSGQGADEFSGNYSLAFGQSKPNRSWAQHLDGLRRQSFQEAGVPVRLQCFFKPDLIKDPYQESLIRRKHWLAFYNLWHEDRTASSHGIETRVPFLDHALVEFLAGVPKKNREALFWDKSVLRQVAQKWMPQEFCERPKHPFVYWEEETEVLAFFRDAAFVVFPEFYEKYLKTADFDFPFDKSAFERLFTSLKKNTLDSRFGFEILFQAMSLVIFQQICKFGYKPPAFHSPSQLGTAGPRTQAYQTPIKGGAPERAWSLNDRLRLSPGVQVHIRYPDFIEFNRNEHSLGSIRIHSMNRFFLDVVGALGASSGQGPIQVQQLLKKTDLSVDELGKVLNHLSREGWISRLSVDPSSRKSQKPKRPNRGDLFSQRYVKKKSEANVGPQLRGFSAKKKSYERQKED